MTNISHYTSQKAKRRRRVRSKFEGTSERPRLTVFRSNRYIYAQVIDDTTGKTLVADNELMGGDKSLKKEKKKISKIERAGVIALNLAKKLKAKKITKLSFDRGHYKYHGRVKKIAEVLRENGIKI